MQTLCTVSKNTIHTVFKSNFYGSIQYIEDLFNVVTFLEKRNTVDDTHIHLMMCYYLDETK